MSQVLSFRAEPGSRHQIEVTAKFTDRPDHRGSLVELSFQHLATRFPAASAPRLSVGQEILLELSNQRLPGPLVLRVRVESRADEPEYLRYGFELVCGEVELGELERLLGALIDRRRSPRVQPPVDTPLRGALRIEGFVEDTPIQVEDLSVLGFSVVVPFELERSCADLGGLLSLLELEGQGQALEIPCVLRNRRTVPDGVLWGCEFNLSFGQHAGRCRSALQSYVDRLRFDL